MHFSDHLLSVCTKNRSLRSAGQRLRNVVCFTSGRAAQRSGSPRTLRVPVERLVPLVGVVHDRLRGSPRAARPGRARARAGAPARRRPARARSGGCSRPSGSNFSRLAGGVEDPEVRRRVGAAAGDPLPVQLVLGDVAVAQVRHEPRRAVPPAEVQVLDQERARRPSAPGCASSPRPAAGASRRRPAGSRSGPAARPRAARPRAGARRARRSASRANSGRIGSADRVGPVNSTSAKKSRQAICRASAAAPLARLRRQVGQHRPRVQVPPAQRHRQVRRSRRRPGRCAASRSPPRPRRPGPARPASARARPARRPARPGRGPAPRAAPGRRPRASPRRSAGRRGPGRARRGSARRGGTG